MLCKVHVPTHCWSITGPMLESPSKEILENSNDDAAYLKDILSHLITDEIIVKLNSPISAGLFYPKEQPKDSDLTMLLMPIRLNN